MRLEYRKVEAEREAAVDERLRITRLVGETTPAEKQTLARKEAKKTPSGFGSSTARSTPDQKSFWSRPPATATGLMSGPRGNPGTLAGDEPEGRLKTSPPRGQQMTKSFELSTVSSRGTKAGGSMHRDGLAMQALKAQIYRQYTHTGLLFGQLDVARSVMVSYESYIDKMKQSDLRCAKTNPVRTPRCGTPCLGSPFPHPAPV